MLCYHVIIDRYYDSKVWKKHSLAPAYLAKKEIRNQISLGEGDKKILNLQFVG